MRARQAVAVALAALCFPATAAAHAGRTAPVASDFVARILSLPAGVQGKVIDGDQSLWLSVSPTLNVVVLGFSGEPYLRFGARAVEANENSPTWFLNRARPGRTPKLPPAGSPPLWKVIVHGHAYLWHEDRLHGLAAAGRAPGSQFVGNWTLPLRINGRPAQIRGGLWHVDAPSLLWFWPAVVLLLGLPALVRLQRGRLNAALGTLFLSATLVAIAVTVAGRALYGRPTVSIAQWIELGVTAAAIAVALRLVLLPDWQMLVGILAFAVSLTASLSSLGALLHGFVIAAFPATVQRLAIATCLAAGTGLLVTLALSDPFRLSIGAGDPPDRRSIGPVRPRKRQPNE